jgi:hypothetical protein
MENTAERKLKCDKIWTIWKKNKLNSEYMEETKLNSDKIWTIWKEIVK